MSGRNIKSHFRSAVCVFQVSDIEKSISWYKKWLGEPDIIPMEGIAEYEISENSWLQLSCEENESLEKGGIIIGVDDINECKSILEKSGIRAGEIADYEVVLVLDILDIDGNRISFAEEL